MNSLQKDNISAAKDLVMTFLILSILLISCSDLGNNSLPQVTIKTDSVSYSVGQSISIVTSNGSEDTIILSPCCSSPDFILQQKVNDIWTQAGYCVLLCPSLPLPLKPLANRVDTLSNFSSGYWRIMLRYYNERTKQNDSVYSNEFTVQ